MRTAPRVREGRGAARRTAGCGAGRFLMRVTGPRALEDQSGAQRNKPAPSLSESLGVEPHAPRLARPQTERQSKRQARGVCGIAWLAGIQHSAREDREGEDERSQAVQVPHHAFELAQRHNKRSRCHVPIFRRVSACHGLGAARSATRGEQNRTIGSATAMRVHAHVRRGGRTHTHTQHAHAHSRRRAPLGSRSTVGLRVRVRRCCFRWSSTMMQISKKTPAATDSTIPATAGDGIVELPTRCSAYSTGTLCIHTYIHSYIHI
jgi:hypothetical protein